MKRDAVISDCGRYRYRLYREWGNTGIKPIMWLMLNPSTVDANIDDQTILKCIRFSQSWGYGAMWVGNLYAYRATYTKELKLLRQEEKEGPHLYSHLHAMAGMCGKIVAAWGNHGEPTGEHQYILKKNGAYCLGRNKNGSPKHPLYLPEDTQLTEIDVSK